MSAAAVILARAGSKGLPGKNALLVAGRPMICHTVEHALAAQCVERIVVSTDGREIAEAAVNMHVPDLEIVHRPPELATDTATVSAALRHAAAHATERVIVVLYANVPVRPPPLIDQAVEMLLATGADSVQSYADVGKQHPYWMVTLEADGRVKPFRDNDVDRRQDLPPILIPDGGVIAVTRASLEQSTDRPPHDFLGADRRGIALPAGSVIDVDTSLDLAVAEAVLHRSGPQTRRAGRQANCQGRRYGPDLGFFPPSPLRHGPISIAWPPTSASARSARTSRPTSSLNWA